MTGWNMPPGVTGREDHFGPEAEHEEWRECNADASLLIVPVDVDLKAIAREMADARKAMEEGKAKTLIEYTKLMGDYLGGEGRLWLALRLLYEAEDIPCPFAGEVEVAYYSTTANWTCPVCRTEYAEERPQRGD